MLAIIFFALQNQAYADNSHLNRKILGKWQDGRIATIEIYEQKGKFYIYRKFGDGSAGTNELNKRKSKTGNIVYYKVDSRHGDHYVITKKGLEMRDDQGLIDIAIPIN